MGKVRNIAIVSVFILAVLDIQCTKEKGNSNLPTCIQAIIKDNQRNKDLKTVRVQKVNGVSFYWLNTDATTYDGTEAIVNSRCDTVCFFCGECIYPECLEQFEDREWHLVWSK